MFFFTKYIHLFARFVDTQINSRVLTRHLSSGFSGGGGGGGGVEQLYNDVVPLGGTLSGD